MRKNQCSNCQFWSQEVSMGYCHRAAPRIIEADEVASYGFETKYRRVSRTEFPMTAPDDWCGDHRASEKPSGGEVGDE